MMRNNRERRRIGFLTAAWLAGATLPGATLAAAEPAAVSVSERAAALHASALVFDGHNDLPWVIRTKAGGTFAQTNLAGSLPQFHTDIPRLRAGNVGAQFWSVYVSSDTRLAGTSATQVFEQIALVKAMIARYPETFAAADTAADVERVREQGKIACLMGIEGGYAIENNLSMLRRFRKLGVRYMTLTHSDTLDWADSSTDDPKHGGLTPFGEEVVREMNRLGLLVDVSHVSDDTVRDVLRVSGVPVIASHSSARAVADHPRNLPDDLIKAIADAGGVVAVNFYSGYVVPSSAKQTVDWFAERRRLREAFPDDREFEVAAAAWRTAHPFEAGTIHDVVDHIDRVVKVAGIDHVGLGSDFDGVSTLPAGLEDVSKYPLITQVLLDRGYSEDDVRKVLGLNLLRALRAADAATETPADPVR